jgi:hypothetical protein
VCHEDFVDHQRRPLVEAVRREDRARTFAISAPVTVAAGSDIPAACSTSPYPTLLVTDITDFYRFIVSALKVQGF